MSYLVIKSTSNATPESYLLTSTTNGPRIAVGGSYIPLSTDMGGGSYEVKVNDGNTTYHVMRTSTSSYSQSASASTTFNTTSDSPDGLESVTNLTRVSTSNTVYQTRASTSATLTRASTSATLTRASTYETLTRASTYETLTRASTYYIDYQTRESTYATAPATAQSWVSGYYYLGLRDYYCDTQTSSGRMDITLTLRPPYFTSYRGTSNWQSTITDIYVGNWNYNRNSGAMGYNWYRGGYRISDFSAYNANDTYQETLKYEYGEIWVTSYQLQVVTTGTINYTQASTYNTIYYTRESIYGYNTRQSVYGYNTRESVSGYATRESVSGYGTRASTSNTVYETRESISGYSGVSTSSSSSSESASGTCWK